jgi:hypothetical protein
MSEGKPPKPDDNRPAGKLSLADLIAQTPGAQPREQLIERINARQQKRPKKQSNPTPSEEDLTKPEPMNIIDDPYGAAPGVVERLQAFVKAKQKKKAKAQPKLTLVRKDGKPVPPDTQ